MDQYEFLLKKILKKLDNPIQKKYVKDNLTQIVKNLKEFSEYFSEIITISLEDIPLSSKIDKMRSLKIKNTRLTKKESESILNALQLQNIVGGGSKEKEIEALKDIHKSVEKNTVFCLTNIGLIASKVFTNLPKYGLLIASKFFSDLAEIYNFDWHAFADFTKKLDWVYLYLFVLASLPITGMFFDMIIIMRSIKQGRIFLAILTFITNLISMLVLHMVDLGSIIKLLYFLDVTSYTSTKNTVPVLKNGNEELFFDSIERNTEVPTDKRTIENLEKVFDKVSESVTSKVPNSDEKIAELDNIKKALGSKEEKSDRNNQQIPDRVNLPNSETVTSDKLGKPPVFQFKLD